MAKRFSQNPQGLAANTDQILSDMDVVSAEIEEQDTFKEVGSSNRSANQMLDDLKNSMQEVKEFNESCLRCISPNKLVEKTGVKENDVNLF